VASGSTDFSQVVHKAELAKLFGHSRMWG
jgi:hypothetical protein